MKKLNLSLKLLKLFKIFNESKFNFFLVGGSIRNHLLKKPIKDFDITTNATPDEMVLLAKNNNLNYFETGKKFGTISFVLDKENIFEVTTFRNDGITEDNRHPKKVTFVKTLKEDLKRRDFTINAFAINLNAKEFKIVDKFNGLSDLEKRIIKCVGDPNERFQEDALRMMRAIRFCAQLGFTLDSATFRGIFENRELLNRISKERIRDELIKILDSDHPAFGLSLLKQTKLLFEISIIFCNFINCDQINQNHMFDVWSHTLLTVKQVKGNWKLKLIMLLHDIGKRQCKKQNEYGIDNFIGHQELSESKAKDFLQTFNFNNKTIKLITTIIKHHDDELKCSRKHLKKKINLLGFELLDILIEVQKADKLSQNGLKQIKIETFDLIDQLILDIKNSGEPLFLKDLAINGNDLLDYGLEPNKIGTVLNRLLSNCLAIPEDNTKETLLKLVKGVKHEL